MSFAGVCSREGGKKGSRYAALSLGDVVGGDGGSLMGPVGNVDTSFVIAG